MTTARSTFNQHTFKKGDKVFLFGSWNGFDKPCITYYIQEYTIYSIGKKQCYLIISDDMLSKKAFYCDYSYGIASTQEEAMQLCNQLMDEEIAYEIRDYEWRNENWENYSHIGNVRISNCKTAKREIIFNPYNKD